MTTQTIPRDDLAAAAIPWLAEYIVQRTEVAENGCWLWTASLGSSGYGVFSRKAYRDGQAYAHRAAYEAFVGPIPTGLVVDHMCENRRCANPAHFRICTQGSNVLRSFSALPAIYARKQECEDGHPLDSTRRKNGRVSRTCSICTARNNAKTWAKRYETLLAEFAGRVESVAA